MQTKVLIINASYYSKVCKNLYDGAVEVLEKNRITHEVIDVPGGYEVPGALNFAAQSNMYDGFILLGCIIKGETSHDEFISQGILNNVLELINKYNAPCGMGILTVNNEMQAMERADKKKKNNGGHAAQACIAMIEIKKRFLK